MDFFMYLIEETNFTIFIPLVVILCVAYLYWCSLTEEKRGATKEEEEEEEEDRILIYNIM